MGRRPLSKFGADRARKPGKIGGGFLIGIKLSVERQPGRFQAIVALSLQRTWLKAGGRVVGAHRHSSSVRGPKAGHSMTLWANTRLWIWTCVLVRTPCSRQVLIMGMYVIIYLQFR